jgi:hypothetical protein
LGAWRRSRAGPWRGQFSTGCRMCATAHFQTMGAASRAPTGYGELGTVSRCTIFTQGVSPVATSNVRRWCRAASIRRPNAIMVFDGRFRASSVSMLIVRFMNRGSWSCKSH